MTDDYRVKPLKNSEVRAFAKQLRKYFGVADAEHIDVLDCLRRPSILTIAGEKPLQLSVLSESDMSKDDGQTFYDGTTITIALKRSIYYRAFMGEGYARNTGSHELGHAMLHIEKMSIGATMARRQSGNIRPNWLKAHESAEHQAKVFAPAFLINDRIAESLPTAVEISVRFGISEASANIYVAERIETRDEPKQRAEYADKIRQLANDIRKSTTPQPPAIQYMRDPCNRCGQATVFPVAHKFMCQTCDTVFDRFQDGDIAE